MTTEKRERRIPLITLEDETSQLADAFRYLVTREYDETKEDSLDEIANELTTVKKQFEDKSRKLEAGYKAVGSMAESRNVKKQRLDLTREAYDFVKELNTFRSQLNLEALSNHCPRYQPSLASVMTKRTNHTIVTSDNDDSIIADEEDDEREKVQKREKSDNTSTAASFLLKADLLKKPTDTFDGNPTTFHMWATILKDRMNCVKLSGIEQLQVLFMNTSGRPQELINDHLSIVTPDSANSALETIWSTLEERYSNKMAGAQILIERLKKLPQVHSVDDEESITRMLDACRNAVCSMTTSPQLQWLNTYDGIHMLTDKLSHSLQSRWRTFGIKSKETSGHNPNLAVFVGFLQQLYKESVDDFFKKRNTTTGIEQRKPRPTKVFRIEGTTENKDIGNGGDNIQHADNNGNDNQHQGNRGNDRKFTGNSVYCFVHETSNHDLKDCIKFGSLDRDSKISIVKNNKLCFRCLGRHYISNCNANYPTCNICRKQHLTIMHYRDDRNNDANVLENKFKRCSNNDRAKATRTHTDDIEGNDDYCVFSKTFPVEIRHVNSDRIIKGVAILDDQSTRCFVDRNIVNDLSINAPNHSYSVETLSGLTTNIDGKLVSNLMIRPINGKTWYELPNTLTSDMIPDTRHEMASPCVVRAHPHLKHLANNFHSPDKAVEPVLLIGADAGELMTCVTYGNKAPYVQRTPLGFALVGPVQKRILRKCNLSYPPPNLHSFRTSVIPRIESSFKASELFASNNVLKESKINVFERQSDDELKGLSIVDGKFLDKMTAEVCINENNHVVLPLPFKNDSPLPNNKDAVFYRTLSTLNKLKKDDTKLEQCLAAIHKNLLLGHVEEIPAGRLETTDGKAWWLPVFPVSHPQKNTARLVFDASAAYQKVSLNDTLMQGPDLNNDLRAVLLRFRRFPVAFTCDIKHMFQNFVVPQEQRDFLRFYWWKNNDPSQPLTQYRSNVHLFGARSSPSIAQFGLKFIAKEEENNGHLSDSTVRFIDTNFYVDDGLQSCYTIDSAITTIAETKSVFAKYSLELHKICSNSSEVMKHFSNVDGEKAPSSVPITPPTESRTLGVHWEPHTDEMVITVNIPDRPFTRRGLLSSINGLFDPIGMIAPVILAGRILQREAMAGEANNEVHWDSPLPESIKVPWNKWKEEVKGVRLSMPRCIFPGSVNDIHLHVFADASTVAIGFVIYATSNDLAGNKHTSFILAGSKVAPRSATTIPRLELCAALEASIAVNNVIRELHIPVSKVSCYTDSQIVLGYLKNHRKSFTRYVSRRIDSIMRICPCGSNWLYVPTSENPADYSSRPTHPSVLLKSNWFTGPDFLRIDDQITVSNHELLCDNLPESVPEQKVLRTNCTQSGHSPILALVERLSSWPMCVKIVQLVLSLARHWSDKVRQKKGTSLAPRDINVNAQAAINFIVSESQHESFPEVLSRTSIERLPEDHTLSGLSVFKDEFGLLRVGGRLKNALGSYEIKHPLILSDKHPLSMRITQYYHEISGHQGRVISHASIRNHGYFIIKGKRLINNIISSCTFCKRLRGNTSVQLMSDLPIERVTESTPFENVGIDVFGPFLVHDGKMTRKSPATKKMYGLLITCLASRAVHVEPLVGLDTPSFINAMRRFSAIRGPCKSILSDHGTNFVGALSSSIDFEKVERDALNRGCIWKMNPPGASHFGGVYERKIGSVRRILEAFFAKHSNQCLSRDEMNTLLQEAVSIINATPLYGITDDPNDPYPITPSMILTLKVEPSCAFKDTFVSSDVMSYGKNRWKKVQFIADQFWDNWRKYYLSELVERRKWKTVKTPIQMGDVVIVKCKNAPRNQWILGLVTQTIKGTDSHVRRVLLKVCPKKGRHRIVEKAIHDLVLLCPH